MLLEQALFASGAAAPALEPHNVASLLTALRGCQGSPPDYILVCVGNCCAASQGRLNSYGGDARPGHPADAMMQVRPAAAPGSGLQSAERGPRCASWGCHSLNFYRHVSPPLAPAFPPIVPKLCVLSHTLPACLPPTPNTAAARRRAGQPPPFPGAGGAGAAPLAARRARRQRGRCGGRQ